MSYFLKILLDSTTPVTPAIPAPAPATDPVVGQQLVAAKAAVAEAKASEKVALDRVTELEAELASAKAAEKSATEEAKAARAALAEVGELGSTVKHLVSFTETEEGRAFLATFAAGEEGFIDKAVSLMRPRLEDLIAQVPVNLVDSTGRAVELVGEILIDGLKDRLRKEQQPEPDPVVPDTGKSTTARPMPRKGKGAIQRFKGGLTDLQELADSGELRLRK